MKLHHALTFAALACAGAGASAAPTDWGTLGPSTDVAFVTYHTASTTPVTDTYSFDLTSVSDVDAYASEFEARSVSFSGATFTLFEGAVGSGTQVGSSFTFDNSGTTHTYSSLATGDYYFEVTGTPKFAGSAYDFEASAQTPGGGSSAVPEPGNVALLLAGLGMVGFVSGRRRRG